MGNSLGGKRTAKVMRIDGQTMKFKTPVNAGEVVKDYPGHVLLESEAVKHYGIRAKPLEPQQELRPKRLYFLVELPKFPAEAKAARRVRSGIQMGAKDRLESLMLARRSVSDLSIMKPASMSVELGKKPSASENDAVRLKLRLPKAEMEKLMMESKDEGEAAEKIMRLCMANNGNSSINQTAQADQAQSQTAHWNSDHGIVKRGLKSREKKVGFLPIMEGEIQQLAVAS